MHECTPPLRDKRAALPNAFRCRRGASPDCWVPVSFDRSMWQNGRYNGKTPDLWGKQHAETLRSVSAMFFLLANILIYQAKIAGFDDKHWFCHYWDATLLHYSCNQTFGTLSAKKRWLLHGGVTSIPLAPKWILPAKIKFQPAEAETSHAMVVNGDVFFCLPCWSES